MPSIPEDCRWCPRCGGALRHVQQRDALRQRIHTFLVCQMPSCCWKKLMMTYQEQDGLIEAAGEAK